METPAKRIENPWCVYRGVSLLDFGRIEEENQAGITIRDSENQTFPLGIWDPRLVEKRFSTLEEAVEYFIQEDTGGCFMDYSPTQDEIRRSARERFPTYFAEKAAEATSN